MSYRKSFLVFVLTFAALTLGRSQEAMGQFDFDWGNLPPGSIDGGSEVFVYHCTQGQGTNTLTVGDRSDDFKSDRLDSFKSDGDVSCDFTGAVKGRGIQCEYNLDWTGDLVQCFNKYVNKGTDAVVTVRARCDDLSINESTSFPNLNVSKPTSSPNVKVSGMLSCALPPTDSRGTFSKTIISLGISSIAECKQLFGSRADILFTAITFAGQSCDQVLKSANDAGGLVSGGLSAKKVRDFVLGGLTATTTKVCHSDGGDVECITPTGDNRSIADLPNLGETACVAEPKIWNVDCHDSKEKDKDRDRDKDNDDGSVCYLNGQAGFFSFEPRDLDARTATLNDVPVELKKGEPLCKITDCNGDGFLDFQCTFPTCDDDTATAAGGKLTMITNFLGDTGGLTCTTTVKTSGKRS